MSTFLEQFPVNERGWLNNLIHIEARAARCTVEEIITAVQNRVAKYLTDPQMPSERSDLLRSFAAALNTPEAKRHIENVIHYEGLPVAERDKIRTERTEEQKQQWMSQQPATEKQLKYLRALGCDKQPTNKWEASQFIDRLVRERNVEQ